MLPSRFNATILGLLYMAGPGESSECKRSPTFEWINTGPPATVNNHKPLKHQLNVWRCYVQLCTDHQQPGSTLLFVCLSVCLCVCVCTLGTCESFFLRSNRISNRIGRPIWFQIEFSNRIGRIYHTYTIGIYFVFVTNESDARNWVLVIHFNSVLKCVKLCRCTII